ncbi:MAG: hypothetical protein ACI8Z1_000876 [Candidatus Azotimanducaceae bacterium]|jgi:hypothetical protein
MKTSKEGLSLIVMVSYPALGYSRSDTPAGLVKRFGGQLKPALRAAMTSWGPAQAIPGCSEKAPAISEALSKQRG